MNTWEIAQEVSALIKSKRLSKIDSIMVGVQIISQLAVDIEDDGKPQTKAPEVKAVPAPVVKDSKVIARKGDTSICTLCGKHLYTVNKDVYEDGMSINEFLSAFTPIIAEYALTRKLLDKVSNVDGNIRIDCPACKGDASLDLIGRRVTKNTMQQAPSPDVSVSSIGGEELGLQ